MPVLPLSCARPPVSRFGHGFEKGETTMRHALQKLILFILSIVLAVGAMVPAYANDPQGDGGSSNDISSNLDVRITTSIENSTVETWVPFTVRVEMSETDAYEIQPGDSVRVTWDIGMRANYSGDLPVVVESGPLAGTSIGTAHITSAGATVVFSSEVTNIQQVGAYIEFQSYATTNGEHTIQAGDVTYTYTSTSPPGPVGSASKDGVWVDATETIAPYSMIRWLIRLNQNFTSDWVGPVRVSDTIADDLELDANFVHIEFYNSRGNWVTNIVGADSLAALGGSFSYNSSSRELVCQIPGAWLNTGITKNGTTYEGPLEAIIVLHTTTREDTNVSGYLYQNNAIVYANGTEVDVTGWLRRPTASAGGSGIPAGTIQITKIVSDDRSPLRGVTFHVYKLNDDGLRLSGWYNGKDFAEITTGEDGIAKLEGLTKGKYAIEEVAAPGWVVRTNGSITVELSETSGTALEIPNEIVKTEIDIIKKWSDQNNKDGLRPNSIHVSLYAFDEKVREATLDSVNQWTYSFYDLPKYKDGQIIPYTVKEDSVEGYTAAIRMEESDGAIRYEIVNTHTPAAPGKPTSPAEPDVPNTGDSSRIALYIGLLCAAAVIVVILILYRKKKGGGKSD